MLQKEVIGCLNCSQAILISQTNHAPEFYLNTQGEVSEIPKNDLAEFLQCHFDHSLQKFEVIDGPWSYQPFIEPVREDFFGIQDENGKKLVLKRWRKSISEPFRYELLGGRITTSVAEISVQEDILLKQLLAEKADLQEWRMESIIDAAKNILEDEKRFIAEELYAIFDVLQKEGLLIGTQHPLHFLLGLRDSFVESLKYAAKTSFSKEDWPFIEKFIDKNKRPDGVLALKVKLGFAVLTNLTKK